MCGVFLSVVHTGGYELGEQLAQFCRIGLGSCGLVACLPLGK